jgi:hypothetical protein
MSLVAPSSDSFTSALAEDPPGASRRGWELMVPHLAGWSFGRIALPPFVSLASGARGPLGGPGREVPTRIGLGLAGFRCRFVHTVE